MKRLWLFGFAVLCTVGIFGVFSPSKVDAAWQDCGPGLVYNVGTDGCISDGTPVVADTINADLSGVASGVGLPTPPSATPPSQAGSKNVDDGSCGLFGSSSITNCIKVGVTWLIKNTLLEIAGFLLWLTTNMFNYAIQIGVLDFKGWAPDALYPIWLIVRQIASLFVVFIGLYLGFMYILGKDEKFARYVPWVVMFALFVNFSYPIVRSAIDVSNIISLNIYASAVGADALDPASNTNAGSLIVSKLGLQGLAASAVSSSGGDSNSMIASINTVPGALLAVCYVLYATYIFFMVTALFVLRTAALVFLIVASPLLLIDSVFPMLGERAKQLRKILFEQLAVGPIFMIMLALTLKFLDVFSAPGGRLTSTDFGQNINGVAASGATNPTVVVFFNILMMLIMLWIMLKVTKSTAGSLGEYATGIMGTVGGYATGAAVGGAMAGTGLLARKGLGGLAAKARDSKWVTNNQDSFIGRRAYNLSNSVANSTFDMRSTAVAQKFAGKLGISSGMGGGTKLGHDEEEKARLEKRTKEALARSSRIKTHHERDVYKDKLDEKGNVVYEEVDDGKGGKVKRKVEELVHRKGEVNAEGWAAKNKLMAATGGATFFMTKEQKQKIKEAMAKDEEDRASKRIAENKSNSAADIATYRGINESETVRDEDGNEVVISAKQSKARFLGDLEKQLKDLEKTDKYLQGDQAQSLIQSIQGIKKAEVAEKAAFDKQVRDAFNNYNRKSGKDQEDYFTNQTDEVQEAINQLKENALDNDRARDQIEESGLDLDLGGSNRESGLNAARNLSGQVQAVLADKPENGALPLNVSPGVAAARKVSSQVQAVLADKSQNDAVSINNGGIPAGQQFDVSQVNFAELKHTARVARQASATQTVRQEMAVNSAGVTTPVPGTAIPSPEAKAPETPAANQSGKVAA